MNTQLLCLRCKNLWWGAMDEECPECEQRRQMKLAEEIVQEDKELLERLAKE